MARNDDKGKQPTLFDAAAGGGEGPVRLPALSPVKRRLMEASIAQQQDDPDALLYQHTVLCQTGLPYRNPGADAREWERINGRAHLKVLAGEAMHPTEGRFVPVGLPYGPKARLILIHLNAEAVRTQSPVIEVEDSMTAFVRRLQGRPPTGPEIQKFKEQLATLAAASIRLGMIRDNEAITVNTQIVRQFNLWFPKDGRQRVLWPSEVQLSLDYFESLARHAVPLDDRAVAALAHNAMALDIYAWLAQRLHRVPYGRPQFITWPILQTQFGWHYNSLRKFRQVFKATLATVHSQYRAARLDLDEKGLTLYQSLPPVKGRVAILPKP